MILLYFFLRGFFIKILTFLLISLKGIKNAFRLVVSIQKAKLKITRIKCNAQTTFNF